ncbi:hypothetical protein SuNHUV7_26130 (plasmid) [Pseudoseohaeicola sp. NH-UV-7]|uniref:hypothetical protein n=1 Tax=Sulfitobacter sp. TBRI5 TaxID=2989732 RepID=UPI003A77F609
MKGMITAVEMARNRGIDPKAFRRALREAKLKWHSHNNRWLVPIGSTEHQEMERILNELAGGSLPSSAQKPESATQPRPRVTSKARNHSDEAWVIDQCNKVLGLAAIRQHRFPFLVGDPGPSGRQVPLPVDAYYPDLGLVIEYHERQHTSSVPFFDKRKTVSGVGRGEQRRLYDERRRELLPKHGYRLIVFDYSEFRCTNAGRLVRDGEAERLVADRLKAF